MMKMKNKDRGGQSCNSTSENVKGTDPVPT